MSVRAGSGRLAIAFLLPTTLLFWIGVQSEAYSESDHPIGPYHGTVRMPPVGTPTMGFSTRVEIARESSVGYVPIQITVDSVGPLPRDRRLTYRFETVPGGQSPPRNGITVEIPISVPQGTRSESFVRYLPKWSAGQAMDISVLEDGRKLNNYDGSVGSVVRGQRRTLELIENEHLTNWVFVDANDSPDSVTVDQIRSILPQTFAYEATANRRLGPTVGPRLQVIGQAELPEDWRAYQRHDVIAIQSDALSQIRANDKGFRAIRDWVLIGGAVIVLDADSPESILQPLNFLWTNDVDASDRVSVAAREFYYYLQSEESSLESRIALQQPSYPGEFVESVSEEEIEAIQALLDQYEQTPRMTPEEWSQQIWMQSAGAGFVLGIKRQKKSIPPRTHLTIAARTLDVRSSPTIRRGVDPLIGDRRFDRWLIPGVAQPPVYTFMCLLTVFVVLVGPVAYRRTTLIGRSYLMFAIAPVLALVTTLAMFGYGIVSDGFGISVRVRQLTWVDGKSGDAGERVRSTYFAGVRPGDGLRFPGNAEVIGYPQGTGKSWEEYNRGIPETIGKILVRPNIQIFNSSFLPSRQQRQFIVHQPRPNLGVLRLIEGSSGDEPPKIESAFEFALREVLVRDGNGDYWHVDGLSAKQSSSGEAVESTDASKILGRLYNDHAPISNVRESSRRPNRNVNLEVFDVIADTNRQLGAKANVSEGIFEQWLQMHLQTLGEIPARHFVATADISPDVLAVEDCEPVASVRYIIGTLQ